MNPEFLIRIIVRAQNEIAGVLDKAAGEVNKLTDAEKRLNSEREKTRRSSKDLSATIKQTQKDFDDFTKSVERGEKSAKDAAVGFDQFDKALRRLGNNQKPGDAIGISLIRAADRARELRKLIEDNAKVEQRLADQAEKDAVRRENERQDLIEKRRQAEIKASGDAQKASEAQVQSYLKEWRAAIDQDERDRKATSKRIIDYEIQEETRRAKAISDMRAKMASEAEQLLTGPGRGDKPGFFARLFNTQEAKDAEAGIRRFRAELGGIEDDVRRVSASAGGRGIFGRILGDSTDAISKTERINDLYRVFGNRAREAELHVGALNTRLRGLIIAGVFAFFQQLVSVTGALGASLISVASAAVQAGAALGGALVAGAAQAIPVIGLLAAAWGRVGAVFDAVKQAQKAQQTAADDASAAADRQRSAANSVRSAQDSLASATKRVTEAQHDLTEARRKGVQELEDLVTAERRARLEHEAAQLAYDQSIQARNAGIRSGDISGFLQSDLDVRSARQRLSDAATTATRATRDRTRVGGNVNNLESVHNAEKALKDAQAAAASASASLANAQAQAASVDDQVSATQKTLNQLLEQLSPAERRLYGSIRRIQDTYKTLFRPITDVIVGAFADAVDKVNGVLDDPRILRPLRQLAEDIGGIIGKIADELTSDRSLDFLRDMANEAHRNLGPLTDIALDILHLFQNIARAGSPALRKFLDFISDLTGAAADATGSEGGLKKLTDFFLKGEEYAESITRLGIALGGLVLALTGTAGPSGGTIIDDLTTQVNNLTDWINSHQREVIQFFDDAKDATYAVATAVFEVVKALGQIYHADQVHLFTQAFTDVVLPALVNVTKVIGGISTALLKFSTLPGVKTFATFLITFGLLNKTLTPFLGLITRAIAGLGRIANSVGLVRGGLAGAEAVTSRYFKLFQAFSALLIVLSGNFDDLGGAVKTMLAAFAPFAALWLIKGGGSGGGPMATGVKRFSTALEGLASSSLLGRLGPLGRFFSGMLGNLNNLIRRLPVFRRTLGNTATPVPLPGRTTSTRPGGRPIPPGAAGAAGEGAGAGAAGGAATAGRGARIAGAARGAAVFSLLYGGIDFAQNKDVGHAIHAADPLNALNLVGIQSPLRADGPLGRYSGSKGFGNLAHDIFGGESGYDKQQRQLKELVQGFQDAANRMSRMGDSAGLRRLVAGIKDVAERTPDAAEALNKIGKAAQTNADRLDKAFGDAGGLQNRFAGSSFLRGLQRLAEAVKPSLDQIRTMISVNIADIGRAFEKGSSGWSTALLRNFGVGIAQIEQGMKDGTISTKDGMNAIESITNRQMRLARDHMDSFSTQGRAQLQKNFEAAAQAVRDNMGDAEDTTRAGMKRISEMLAGQLEAFGISKSKARKLSHITSDSETAFMLAGRGEKSYNARGGIIGLAGEKGRDLINTVLGRGEVVLNHWQQRAVNAAMAGRDNLYSIVNRVRGYHAGGPENEGYSGGYAGLEPSGGTSIAIPGFPGEFADSRVARKMADFAQRFRMFLTDAFATAGHTGQGHLFYGNAADYVPGPGGSWDLVNKAVAYAVQHPETFGAVLYDGRFGSTAYPNHGEGNHAHIEFDLGGGPIGQIARNAAQRAKKGVDAIIAQIATPTVKGNDSALKTIAQQALKRATSAANERLADLAGSATGGGGGGNLAGFSGGGDAQANMRLGQRMAKTVGWVGAQWRALRQLWIGESGWRANADNPTSDAYGIPQALPGSKMASAGKDWMTNAATQIRWGIEYIKQRYGDPVKALAFWNANSPHWYADGGPVRGDGSGTSDSIWARLSNGEHVWTAKEVANAGGHGVMRALRAVFGGGGQGGPTKYAQGGQTLLVGDSLGVGTKGPLADLIKGLTSDTQVGRRSDEALDILKKKLRDVYQSVIFDVGTNDASAEALAKSLRKARNLLGNDQQLFVPTVRGPEADAKNRAIRNFAKRNDNVTVIPWAGVDNVTLDSMGIHPNASGYQRRAELVARSVQGTAAAGGAYSGPGTLTTPAQLQASFANAFKQIKKITADGASTAKTIANSFNNLTGDNGLFSALDTAIQATADRMAAALKNATYRMTKTGNVVKALDDEAVTQRTLDNLGKTYDQLVGERGSIKKSLDLVNDRMKEMVEKDGKDAKSSKAYQALEASRTSLRNRLDNVRSQIADNLESQFQTVEDQISAMTSRFDTQASNTTGNLDLVQRMQALTGNTIWSRLGLPGGQAQGQARSDALNTQANQYQYAAYFARQSGHTDTADALDKTIQDLRLQAREAVASGLQADVDEVTRQASNRGTAIDIRSRIADALGKTDVVASLFTDRIQNAQQTIADLTSKRDAANAQGFGGMAEAIQGQIDDLNASITEYTAQQLAAQVAAVDAQASRDAAAVDRSQRIADVVQKAGNSVGAAQLRVGALQQQGANIQGQIGQYAALLAQAQAQGNVGQATALADKIADLQTALIENTQAIKDAVTAVRQAQIDLITTRNVFQTGVLGNLSNIIESLGQISGVQDAATQISIAQQTAGILGQTGNGLRDILANTFGIDLRGLSGTSFVNAVRGINFDQAEAGLSEADKKQFEDLINAIIENEAALVNNTNTIKQLEGAMKVQSFTTTAWQLFRQAIFNGSGGLLPSYDIPLMDTGGYVRSDGLAYLHAAEVVRPASWGGDGGSIGEMNINITEPMEVADPVILSNAIAFKLSQRGKMP